MEIANQIFFLVFALLSLTFLLSYLWQFNFSKNELTNYNLLISIALYTLCCLCFALAPWINRFLLTIANVAYVAANIALVILYANWNNQQFSRRATVLFWFIPIVIGLVYEPLRLSADTFQQRVALITFSQELLLLWQAFILYKIYSNNKLEKIVQLIFILTLINFAASFSRTLSILSNTGQVNIFLYSEDILTFGMRWLAFTTVLLIYIVIGIYYWQKQISKELFLQEVATLKDLKNKEILALLMEKELLINSLLKVNKTVETGALSASIAHELNQPLGASSLNIHFLQQKLAENKLSPQLGQEILGQLASDNLRASNIIKSLRDIFSRDTAITGQNDLNALIKNVLSFINPELAAHQIKVNLELAPEVSAPINSNEIQQVLVNLLNNAINALVKTKTTKGGLVTIQSFSTDDEIRISISDNGPGISQEQSAQLFDIFSGASKSSMGLGLWLCKHIVERHNGKIWYDNMHHQGAKFIVMLPKFI